jgi:hypothetical protein
MGRDWDRHTIKEPIGGDLTHLGDALLLSNLKFRNWQVAFPSAATVRGQVTTSSIVPPGAASRIEAFQHVHSVNRE